MTYRIDRTTSAGRIVLALSGDVGQGQTAELQMLLGSESAGTCDLDLKDVTLLDRDAVRFLAMAAVAGARILNCPDYVRRWIATEHAEDVGHQSGDLP
jgi:hypothetical protein